jgi:hypothetical protein
MAVFLNFTWMRMPYPEDRGSNVVRLRDDQAPLVLGRSPEVPIRLEANTVSRRHAELRVEAGKVSIRDIGAINGIRRFPGDQRCEPWQWVDVPPLHPIFVTEYQLIVLQRPPLAVEEYRRCTDLDTLLRLLPGPNVQGRLGRFEDLLTRPELQPTWTYGRPAPSLLEDSGINQQLRPPLGDPVPFHFRVRMLLRTAQEAGLLAPERSLALVRDLLGDFLLELDVPPCVGTWRDGLIQQMVQTIDQDRCYQDLPILADALEEAGCEAGDLLDHLRADIPHFPGCWAVELLRALPDMALLPQGNR